MFYFDSIVELQLKKWNEIMIVANEWNKNRMEIYRMNLNTMNEGLQKR